jgi:Flp pilus assembly protein TadD
MYKIILPLVAVALVACSSSSKDDSEESLVDDAANSAVKVTKTNTKNKPKSVAHSQNTSAPSDQSLVDAIKSHDDEMTFKLATQKLSVAPQDMNALNALGLYHLRKGRPIAAKLFFNKMIQIKQNSSEAYSNIGLAHLALKENKDAIYAFKKAIELDSTNVVAGMNLSSLYLSGRDFSKAYSVLSLIEPKANRDITFLNNFALAAAEYGKVETAEVIYREALKSYPSHKELLYNFAIFQIDYLRKYKEGLETLDRLKFLGLGENMRNNTNALENRAKAGLK